MRIILLGTLLWVMSIFISSAQAGTPNFLMWIGKEQDALIIGEIVEKVSAEQKRVNILAVFPQTKDKTIKVGKTISVILGGAVGDKLLLSLNAIKDGYQVKWNSFELTHDTTSFSNARLILQGTTRDDYQLLISSAGKYLTPNELFDNNLTLENAQVPKNLLKQIPTRELLQIWLIYPQITLISEFNSPQKGMDQLRRSFNALPELLNRTDIVDELLTLFDENKVEKFQSITGDKNTTDFIHQQTALVLLLAQPEIIKQLSFYQKPLLNRTISQRLDEIAQNEALAHSSLSLFYQLLAANLAKD